MMGMPAEQDEGLIKVDFTANPTQRKFIESRAEADMFASRKGEGKSAALVWACFYHTQHNPGAHWLFIRDTWENLKRTTLEEFRYWFPEGVFGKWLAEDKCFVWDTERTGLKGKVYFMGADDEAAATKIASMPLAGLAIDEPSAASGSSSGVAEFVFDTAWAQLRQPGMNWYAAKLAQNNPDESHWTYRRFVDPGQPPDDDIELLPLQDSGFKAWQTREPENKKNLKPGYYESLAKNWAHRPDLVKRFVTGQYGYQQVGKAVTPEWRDEIHLARGLMPMKGMPLHLCWDGGLNASCVITQVTPAGFWLILEAHVGEEVGAFQLIENIIKPAIRSRYRGFKLVHTGDPNLNMREQSNANQSAAKLITKSLGGRFISGPVTEEARIEPLRAMMSRTINGVGQMQVDKARAKAVWFALRGGWHWHITRSGQQGSIVKDIHSHPADCVSYGSALLFPLGKAFEQKSSPSKMKAGGYYRRAPGNDSLGMANRKAQVPKEAKTLRR